MFMPEEAVWKQLTAHFKASKEEHRRRSEPSGSSYDVLNWFRFLKSSEMCQLNVELYFPKKACEQLAAE